MDFTFKHSSCVAVGTFNIYIVQPKLLAEMGVFETEQPVLISGDLTRPGIRFEVNNAVWTVRPDRLSVESKAPNVDCGLFVERTLAALCWTQIMGVGVNSVFTSPSESESQLPSDLRLPVHPDATQRTSHLSIPRGDSVLNIQMTYSENQLELSLNTHMDFSQKKGNSKEANESVRSFCGSFIDLRTSAVDFANRILKAEFIYDR